MVSSTLTHSSTTYCVIITLDASLTRNESEIAVPVIHHVEINWLFLGKAGESESFWIFPLATRILAFPKIQLANTSEIQCSDNKEIQHTCILRQQKNEMEERNHNFFALYLLHYSKSHHILSLMISKKKITFSYGHSNLSLLVIQSECKTKYFVYPRIRGPASRKWEQCGSSGAQLQGDLLCCLDGWEAKEDQTRTEKRKQFCCFYGEYIPSFVRLEKF